MAQEETKGPEQTSDKTQPPAAASPQASDGGQDAHARSILKSAREQLIDYKSVRAEILETVVIGPRRFQATGNYLQGVDLMLRLDYTVKVGNTIGSFLQVCDGGILWTRHRISRVGEKEDTSRITRRDVREILNTAASSGRFPENILIAELGLGGIPALLAALERSMKFDKQSESSIDKVAFTVIEGTWNDEFSKKWRVAPEGGQERTELPSYVPDRIRIYFDQENLFPRRVLYLKKTANQKGFRSMVALDFRNVVLNSHINPDEFRFVPDDKVLTQDVTDAYLQRLGPRATSTQTNETPSPKDTPAPTKTSAAAKEAAPNKK